MKGERAEEMLEAVEVILGALTCEHHGYRLGDNLCRCSGVVRGALRVLGGFTAKEAAEAEADELAD